MRGSPELPRAGDIASGPSSAGLAPFWTLSPAAVTAGIACGPEGLTSQEARNRLLRYGPNSDAIPRGHSLLGQILPRALEPLSLVLLVAALISIGTGDGIGGMIIVATLVISIGLDTFQEGHAARAAEMLRRSVALKAEAKRDGAFVQIAVDQVVPGDLLRIRAGDIIPADALILESSAFTSGEAALTGEPYPVEKNSGTTSSPSPGEATNALFRGAVAMTGEAIALAVGTGRNTIFGSAAAALDEAQTPSPFQRDLRQFGLVIARLTLVLVVIVLASRILMGRPPLDSLLFAVALAVGLAPELLPMITTVTLSRGAMRMARRKVIVKRLASIHDLGAMTLFCTDKTGTLTEAEVRLARSLDPEGNPDPRPAHLAAIAALLGGDRGALDAALAATDREAARDWRLGGQRAFDFTRRLGSVRAEGPEGRLLIVKGAPEAVLPRCTTSRDADRLSPLGDIERARALDRVEQLAADGFRCVAVASRPWVGDNGDMSETDLTYEGLCAFADPAKPTAAGAIARLAAAGIQLKILSGDDPVVVKRLAAEVGLKADKVMSGAEVAALGDDALAVQVRGIDAYGRLTPDQKSRIIAALRSRGAIVGYLGDGINDAPALKAADIGLSVEGATGVAQAAADMILMAPDLEVVADGVEEGRRTFANILKYIHMGASSNFGNMLSMAVASVALPYLPMLPTQILLNNLLYDFSELGIPFDGVSPEATARPRVWNIRALGRFAGIMGPLSSVFDFITFGVLLWIFKATPALFQTAWFMESMATQILVIFVIRTTGRPWSHPPSRALTVSSLLALGVAIVIPFTPAGVWFGFTPLSPAVLLTIAAIVVAYLVCAEFLKPVAIVTEPTTNAPLAPRG